MNSPLLPDRRPDYELAGPMGEEVPRGSHFRVRRFFAFLLKYWWVPALTLTLGLGAGITYLRWIPPSFVSIARMWETERVRLPEGTLFSEDMQNFLGTQTELLQAPNFGVWPWPA